MATSACGGADTKRIAVSLIAWAVFLASGSPTPARGQCSPQELEKLTASDATVDDVFGITVAISGDTAVVGAYTDDHAGGIDAGSAYVFVRSGGVWTQQAKLTADDAAAGDNFGISVSISGDTAVVGGYLADHAGGTDAGSAYVFVRSGTVWTQQTKLIALDSAATDYFGYSVALSGETAVVGGYLGDHAGGIDAGSAYVFTRSGTTWTQQAKLTASDAAATDQFGIAVTMSGDTAVVGANLDNSPASDAGSAYVFVRSGGVWNQQAKLTASDAQTVDQFGFSVAVSDETALIGARFDDAPLSNAGSAYVFTRSGTTWAQQAKLVASDAVATDEFGIAVAVSGDTALVGAWHDDHPTKTDAGSAYVFVRSGALWTQHAKVIASDGEGVDHFGTSVAVNGDTALFGAEYATTPVDSDAGATYVFVLGIFDSDGDGVADLCDPCPNNAPDLSIFPNGRPQLDRNGDCFVDGADIQLIVDEMLNQ